MSLITAITVIMFLSLIGLALYLIFIQEVHKKSTGIPIGDNSVEDILIILREKLHCPLVKEVKINEKGNLELVCKHGVHTGKIENGKLNIDKLARKMTDFENTEEAWHIEKHVERIFNPEKAVDENELESKFDLNINICNTAHLIRRALYLCIALLVFLKVFR